jgi:peptide/nickel transport system ATP-binding protein
VEKLGMKKPVLVAQDLEVDYERSGARSRSLDSATLSVAAGEIVALVGESGSGKTTFGMAAGRMLAANARYVGGTLRVGAGVPVLNCSAAELKIVRQEVLGWIFQNPVAALDPTMRVERQMNRAARRAAPRESVATVLASVGLREVPRVLRAFPHELSGGMAQRVAIAMALRRRPQLLIADEPTASIDATAREEVLRLLVDRCRSQGCALLLLTHDLHAVARFTDRIAVMYAGRVVETGRTPSVLAGPLHPYTRALIGSVPGKEQPGERLSAIGGLPPVLVGPSTGCAFAPRCPAAIDICTGQRPSVEAAAGGGTRTACCHLAADPPRDDRSATRREAE